MILLQIGPGSLLTMLRTALDAIKTVVGAVLAALYTFLVASYVAVAANLAPQARHLEYIISSWGKVVVFCSGTRMAVDGADKLTFDGGYVIVSNHLSNLDAPLHIAKVPVPIRFLAKAELFRIPIFGRAMKAVGMIETDRQAHASAHRSINLQVARVVEMGRSLMIYPEGRRSRNGELQPFKKGAFRIAIDNEMPIVPVTIAGTDRAWKPGTKVVHGGRTRMIIHDPIPTTGLARDDIASLRDRVHTIIDETYRQLRS
jgi:1-acyl-sn-glycerol-3-phosphate acyltransferase